MSAGELGRPTLPEALGELAARLDQVETQAKARDGVVAECVMWLAKSVDELANRVALLGQADGVVDGRRVS